MNADDGTLRFGTAIDTSGFDAGVEHMETASANLTSSIEEQTSRITEIISNVPGVNLDVVVSAEPIQQIEVAFQELDKVINENETEVKKLEDKYKDLAKQMALASQAKNDASVARLQKEIEATKALITERKKVLAEAGKQVTALTNLERAQKQNTVSAQQNAEAQMSLKQRLRELKLQLVEMEAAGMRNTEAFRAIQNEASDLADRIADAQSQVNILANDQRGMQGLISGLSGVAGAFSAAQGAVALFGGENEDLQKIMLKVQSLMAITMGLQQVQATLNKDSAFSLVTLNGLKEWWNKLLAVGTAEQTAEIATTEAETVAQEGDAVATAQNAAAHEALAVSAGQATAAEGATAAATGVETAAAGAGTVANISLAGAFRMVGAAIKSIPVFGWIAAAIGVLIGVISHFVSKANEMSEKVKEKNEMLKESRKVYANAKAELDDYKAQIDDFNGSAEQEKKLVQELNSKYGEHLGYCKTLGEWKSKLAEKGDAYCEMMMMEAEAQAILSKATDAYINLLEVKAKAESGEYDHWWQTKYGDELSRKEAIDAAEADVEKWRGLYQQKRAAIRQFSQANDLGFHADASSAVKITGNSSSTFDPVAAARKEKEALEQWKDAVIEYQKRANEEIQKDNIGYMNDGLAKEIAQSKANTQSKIDAWNENLRRLAEAQKEYLKEKFLAQKGATLEAWESSEDGQRSVNDYMKKLLAENPEMAQTYQDQLARIEAEGVSERIAIQQRYQDALIEEFGNIDEKTQLITRKWTDRINSLPDEFRERFMPEMLDQMEKEIADLKLDDFKLSIDWQGVFGDLSNQSLAALEFNLNKIKEYFNANKEDMDVTQIKDYQEAMAKMEEEIASRNPFTALHQSLDGISTAKTNYISAMQDMANAEAEHQAALQEYNDAVAQRSEFQGLIDAGEMSEQNEEYIQSVERVDEAERRLTESKEKQSTAERNVLTARNKVTSSYAKFANNLKSASGVITSLGGKAKNLASVFSDDIADSIGKALDFIDELSDAAASVITAIGDVGKGVAQSMNATVEATGTASKAAAASTATAISTVEKASVILTIISAALQVATAIANLFNNDGAKQKEIEKLQERIDQLQWELDNADTVRLQNEVGNAVDKLRQIYQRTTDEVLRLHGITSQSSMWVRWFGEARYSAEIYRKSVEKIADAYAKVDYTADKALGADKYADSRKQLENLAEQQLLIQKQMDAENSKKKTDDSKIQDYKNQIAEIAEEMATLINEMLEEIIGYTAEDLAKELGDAFFEAAQQGEDAMEAWQSKVKEIIADITKQMLITKFLEEPLGEIFNKYKKRWFGDDGTFKGIDEVVNSMASFSNDLNQVGSTFQSIWESLPDDIKNLFPTEADFTQDSSVGGFQSMSEETGQELNGRFTAMQIAMEDVRSLSDLIKIDTGAINENVSLLRDGMYEIQNIALLQLGQLESINKNTKELGDISQTLDRIDKNIQNL